MNSCRFCQLFRFIFCHASSYFCLTTNLSLVRSQLIVICHVSFLYSHLIFLLLLRRRRRCHDFDFFLFLQNRWNRRIYLYSHCFIASSAHFMHLFQFHEQLASERSAHCYCYCCCRCCFFFIEAEYFASCHFFFNFSSTVRFNKVRTFS